MSSSGSEQKTLFERYSVITILAVVLLFAFAADFLLIKVFWKSLPLKQQYSAVKIRRPHPYYEHTLKPNVDGWDIWGGKPYRLKTNSLGYKDSGNRVIQRTSTKKRIVFIGDSFTEGIGLPYEKTFVGIIDEALEDSTYEILNAGVSSYSPKLYYLKIKHLVEVLRYDIDEIILFADLSDMQDEIAYEGFSPRQKHSFSLGHRIKVRTLNYLVVNSLLGNIAYYYISRNASKGGKPGEGLLHGIWKDDESYWKQRQWWYSKYYEQWGQRGEGLARGNMEKLIALCNRNGIKMSIVIYPWPKQITEGRANNRQTRFWKGLAQENGLGFMDLFPYFIERADPQFTIDSYYIKDDVHFNEKGHRAVAEEFLETFGARL